MLSKSLKEMGVVGAGGAGFPTCVKAGSEVEFVLANGAECEPLIHKDYELMKHFPGEVVAGLHLMMKATKAKQGKFGIKEKNAAAVAAIQGQIKSKPIEMVKLGDFYPSGDEYELVYSATGRLIPPAGIPLQVGCVVNNVETLYNVHQAQQGRAVTEKFVTVCGAVKESKSFWVPVGTPFRDLLARAGGASVPDFAMFVSGILMGTLCCDVEEVVTKTTGGLIVLPREHYLVQRRSQPRKNRDRIGKSACDQCSYCTEFCPRYLLGYEVMPHKVMRSLGFTMGGGQLWNQWAQLCCGCGLCTLYACPEELFPKETCDNAKFDLKAAGIKFVQQKAPQVHPLKEGRRVPLAMLRRRMRIEEYEREAPYEAGTLEPERVRIKLSQHVGQPAKAAVAAGDAVARGAVVGRVGEKDLGAWVHASIDGVVEQVTDSYVEIARK